MRPDATRVAYDGRLIDVVVERWGEHEREIVEHPGAVAIVAVDGADRVVLVRQLREAVRRELLELPAGPLERGEEAEAAARRELREETGLRGGAWRELADFYTTPGFCREHMRVFLAEGVEEGEAEPAADERLEVVRWPVEGLDRRIGELDDAKTVAGLLLFLRGRGG
jgi:ADP-ribose pyrophosphatase